VRYNRAMCDFGEMPDANVTSRPRRALTAWLAGPIGIDRMLAMSERLAWEVSEPDGRPPTLVLHELEPSITLGRAGSRTDVDLTDDELRAHRLSLTFVGRGGGAVLHGPGQVGVSLFATLADLGLGRHDVGGYLERFEHALEAAVRMVRCGAARDSSLPGIFGRTGLLAAVGVAVRRGVVWHGGFLNVCPPLSLHHRVRSLPVAHKAGMRTMGSIEADVQRPVRLQDVRSALVQQMVDAFGFPRVHVQAGFPVAISALSPRPREVSKRVG
jgi:lipoyl(octanoyl) transferase